MFYLVIFPNISASRAIFNGLLHLLFIFVLFYTTFSDTVTKQATIIIFFTRYSTGEFYVDAGTIEPQLPLPPPMSNLLPLTRYS
jgi:hypothetical protein